MLATVSMFAATFGSTLDAARKVVVGSALDQATALIEAFCDRSFGTATRQQWVKVVDGFTVVDQYPVTRIKAIGVPVEAATVIGTDEMPSVSASPATGVALSLDWVDSLGEDQSADLLVADYGTLADLKDALEDVSDSAIPATWTMTITSGMTGVATSLIQPMSGVDATDGAKLHVAQPSGLHPKCDPESEGVIDLDGVADGTQLMVKYTAGYTLPVDNVGQTALTTVGTVPKDLSLVCIQVANDIVSLSSVDASGQQDGTPAINLLKSETLGDHSWTRLDKATVDSVVSRYETVLARYVKRTFQG